MKYSIAIVILFSLYSCQTKQADNKDKSTNTVITTTEAYISGDTSQAVIFPSEYNEKDSVVLPTVIKRDNPEYPDSARLNRIDGIVYVKIWVDKTGKPKRAMIDSTTNIIFNQASLKAAMNWSFNPAQRKGLPIDITVKVPFKFKTN